MGGKRKEGKGRMRKRVGGWEGGGGGGGGEGGEMEGKKEKGGRWGGGRSELKDGG